MEVSFSPGFLRILRGMKSSLQGEVMEKVEQLTDEAKHHRLKVHKLHGRLKGCYAFSVSYDLRVLFEFVGKPRRAYLLTIGNHDDYNRT